MAIGMVVASASCGGETNSDGELDLSCETTSYGNESAPGQLDLLFVIDLSPSMAAYGDRLVANLTMFVRVLETINGGLPGVHLAVVSTDLAASGARFEREPKIDGCAPPDGPFLIDQREPWFRCAPEVGRCGLRNYDGELAVALTCIGALRGEGAEDRRLLEVMRRALDGSVAGNLGFRRDDAWLAVVLVTDGDDESDAPVAEYADFLRSLDRGYRRVVVGVVARQDSARLAALRDELQWYSAFASIDDAEWWDPMALVASLFSRTLGISCLRQVDTLDRDFEEPGIQLDCSATEVVPVAEGYAERVIPPCRMAAADRPHPNTSLPCWWIADMGPEYAPCRLIPLVERAAAGGPTAVLRCVGSCDFVDGYCD